MNADFDVVVAGGGIAGLTAALTCARLGRRTIVLTGQALGGQLLSIGQVEGFPGFPEGIPGYELCPLAQEQAASAGAELNATEVAALEPQEGSWVVKTTAGIDYAARAVIVATGSEFKPLGVPGEERLRGKGVSHCASCDAPLLRGRVVAVVGGGDSAAQEALTLAGSAARVVMIHRGSGLSAQATYRARIASHPNIEVRLETIVHEILGESGVTGARTQERSGAVADVDLAGVFVYIGLEPNTAFLKGRLPLDGTGRLLTDACLRTPRAGLCAAGSVRSGWSGRAVGSAGDGALAARAVDRYLGGGLWRDTCRAS